jgi:hypothetical protein
VDGTGTFGSECQVPLKNQVVYVVVQDAFVAPETSTTPWSAESYAIEPYHSPTGRNVREYDRFDHVPAANFHVQFVPALKLAQQPPNQRRPETPGSSEMLEPWSAGGADAFVTFRHVPA